MSTTPRRPRLLVSTLVGAVSIVLVVGWLALFRGEPVRMRAPENRPAIPDAPSGLEKPATPDDVEQRDAEGAQRIRAGVPVAPDEPATDADLAATLNVRVVEVGSDEPVPGARVLLFCGGATLLERTTDASGRFEWTSPTSITLDSLGVGATRTTASAMVLVDLCVRVGARQEITARVGPGAILRGRVVTEEGTAVSGAEIRAWNTLFVQQAIEARLAPDRVAPSGPAGDFELEHMGEHVVLHASSAALVSEEFLHGPFGSVAPQVNAITLVMRTPCSLDGVVRAPSGHGLPGCRVSAQLVTEEDGASERGPLTLVRSNERSTSTRDDGRFRLDGLTASRYRLVVEHDDWARRELEVVLPRGELEVLLDASERRGGGVLRWTGRPAVGALVRLCSRTRTWETEVDSNGDFVLERVPELELAALSVVDPLSAAFAIPWDEFDEGQVLQLAEPLSIDGVLVDENGAPIPGTFLSLEGDRTVTDPLVPFRRVPWEFLEPHPLTVTNTDGAGAFRFERLHQGTYTLTARVPDASRREASWRVDAGQTGVTLRVAQGEAPSVTLRGVVIGPAGEAVTTFQVLPFLVDDRGALGAARVYPFEDAQGRFEIQGLEEGSWMIMVRSDGFEEAVLEPADYRNGVNPLTIELGARDE